MSRDEVPPFRQRSTARILTIIPCPVEAIVVSHGHFDHSGALLKVLEKLKRACPERSRREGLPILVHEDMFKPRGTEEDGKLSKLPPFPS